MSELTLGRGELRAGHRAPETGDVLGYRGRHAVDEDAVLTPIFHALSRGGWCTRQESPVEVAATPGVPLSTIAANLAAALSSAERVAAAEPSAAPVAAAEPVAQSVAAAEPAAQPVAAAEAVGQSVAAPDPIERFRRDPLAAPLPTGVLAAVPNDELPSAHRRAASGAHAMPEVRRGGRHHRRLIPLDGGAGAS